MPEERKLITVTEMAKKWGMSPTMVRRLAAQGRIEGTSKPGNEYLLPFDAKHPRRQKPGPDPK